MVDPELVKGAPPERFRLPIGLANKVDCKSYSSISGIGHGEGIVGTVKPHHLIGS